MDFSQAQSQRLAPAEGLQAPHHQLRASLPQWLPGLPLLLQL